MVYKEDASNGNPDGSLTRGLTVTGGGKKKHVLLVPNNRANKFKRPMQGSQCKLWKKQQMERLLKREA
jgi:hypothetical protein